MSKINLKGTKKTTFFLTVQESLVSEGCCPVLAHLQCPGKQRFQCSPSRYLHGDRDCSLIFLQKLSSSRESSWLNEQTQVVFVGDSFVWRMYLWNRWDGWLWGSGTPLPDQTHQAWLSLPPLQPDHILQVHINRLSWSFANCWSTTTVSSTEGINYLQTLQRLWQVGERTKHQVSLTCSEGMAGIQTHSHSGLVPHFIDDAPQLREGAPHRATLTAHVLQHWVHGGEAIITLTHQSCKYLIAEAPPGGDCATFPVQEIVQLHQQHLRYVKTVVVRHGCSRLLWGLCNSTSRVMYFFEMMVFLCNLFLEQFEICAPRQVEIPKITSE